MEKSPRLNWATQFLMMAHDGGCSPKVSLRMAKFPSAACLAGGELDDSSCLDVVEIMHIALHASFQPL